MDFVTPVNELEQQLKEAGLQLALCPTSTKDLLDLLDKTEQLLTVVGQAPSISMQGALVPSMGALISDELIKHSEVDVRVSVASCLCEVARITAPEPPYNDEIMKGIFQLNVMAFGQLSNVTGRSYYKAIHVLESVAKVKSCLLMLDLECDALVLEMFDKFLSTIRINHPHAVFSDMETIMTLVIEESDEIDTELLSLLISHVRKEKQIVSPAPWKLAEKVLWNCNDTLKSYSETIKKLVNSDPDDYAEVVTVLCQNANENGLVVTRSTRSKSIYKTDLITLENGGSMKKQQYTDTQRVGIVPKKIDKNQLKGKEQETPAKGRPRKNKNNSNHDNRPDLVQNSPEDLRKTRSQDKSKGMKGSTGKPEKQSTKIMGNIETSGSLYNVAIKKEDEDLSDHGKAELLNHQMNNKVQNRRKPSSKKHVANGSYDKEYGEELVGRSIRVWWPLDKLFYKGAVFSYNPKDKKHKILYADGDEELLNLSEEKWEMFNLSSIQQHEQVADSPSSMNGSAKRRKQNGKRKQESSLAQDKSNSPKRLDNLSQTPADSSKIKPTKEHDITGANTSTTEVICIVDNQKDIPVQTPDISCGLKLMESTIEKLEPSPSGELQVQRLPESSETTQRSEETANLVGETSSGYVTAQV